MFLLVTDRDRLRPVRVGLEIAAALVNSYGAQFTLEQSNPLIGSKATVEKIRAGVEPAQIAASWRADEERWRGGAERIEDEHALRFGRGGSQRGEDCNERNRASQRNEVSLCRMVLFHGNSSWLLKKR